MEIQNAKIKDVTIGFDDRDRLVVSLNLKSQNSGCHWSFKLENQIDVQRLIRLMHYTCSHEVEDLGGKIIRKVDEDNLFRGFGDPIKDKFVPVCTEEFKEITESEFKEMLK